MTPKEKAQELFMRNFEITIDDYCAKQCALVVVYEIIKVCEEYDEAHETHTTQVDYWKEVKSEIEKL